MVVVVVAWIVGSLITQNNGVMTELYLLKYLMDDKMKYVYRSLHRDEVGNCSTVITQDLAFGSVLACHLEIVWCKMSSIESEKPDAHAGASPMLIRQLGPFACIVFRREYLLSIIKLTRFSLGARFLRHEMSNSSSGAISPTCGSHSLEFGLHISGKIDCIA